MEHAAKRSNISHANKEGHFDFDNKKKLLVLSVNGLLADLVADPLADPDEAVFKRPFCDDFLKFCFQRFNVGIWTSLKRYKMERALDILMRDTQHKLLFCWDRAHCTKTSFTVDNYDIIASVKDLRKLWEKKDPNLPWELGEYDESNTLLVENYPHAALLNPPHTAIFPYHYHHWHTEDNSLGPKGDLRIYLERLAASENVQKFVSEYLFGQRPIREKDLSLVYYQKSIRRISYKCKKSSEPEANSSTPLAAQTSIEPQAAAGTTTDYQQNWPFIKQSPIWASIDSLLLRLTPPQKPHFSPLNKTKELHREGLAIAHMMTCWNLVQSLPNIKLNDPVDIINDNLEVLVDLETHGFDVGSIRGRLNELLSLKSKASEHEDTLKELEKRRYEKLVMEKETDRIKLKMQKWQEKLVRAETMKKVKDEEIIRLQSNLHPNFNQINDWELAFEKLAATPL